MPPIAVIDLETTGLSPSTSNRIVEIAVILLEPHVGIVGEFETIVNPRRDVGPTHIHGLTASDVSKAPSFSEIAAPLSNVLSRSGVLAGHNVAFDIRFILSEYNRLGIAVPPYRRIDTMRLAGGGGLGCCCERHGIPFLGTQHSAICDARATALLLQKLILNNSDLLESISQLDAPCWSPIGESNTFLLPRESLKTQNVDSETPSQAFSLQSLGSLHNRRVCFSGESNCVHGGQRITRELAERIAQDHGLVISRSLTRSLDFLVVADVATQSGKAQRARKYGIPIVSDTDFWCAIGVTLD